MMKLIGTVTSPYTRKVRVALAEKRMECEFIIDSPNTGNGTVEKYNPLGKIPVLVLDDEQTIFDSRVIVEYLDNASPGNRLIPEEKRPRIQVRRWEALADGCTDAAVAIVVEKRRATEQQSSDWIAGQQRKVDRALQAMADELAARSWCAGGGFRSQTLRPAAAWVFSKCAFLMCRGGACTRTSRALPTSWHNARRSGIRHQTDQVAGGVPRPRVASGGQPRSASAVCACRAESMMPPPRQTRLS